MKKQLRRGATLFEVLIGASVSAMTLVAGVGLFMGSMMNWAKGSGAIDSMQGAQQAARLVAQELREATSATISANGQSITYTVPRKANDGSYQMPMTNDTVSRTISVNNGRLVLMVGPNQRIIASDILTTVPGSTTSYRIFTAPSSGIVREIGVEIYCSKFSTGTNKESSRAIESVILRNVAQVSR